MVFTPIRPGMENKDGDRSSGGLPQTLGSGDAKPAQPPSSVKNEVCLEMCFFVSSIIAVFIAYCTVVS